MFKVSNGKKIKKGNYLLTANQWIKVDKFTNSEEGMVIRSLGSKKNYTMQDEIDTKIPEDMFELNPLINRHIHSCMNLVSAKMEIRSSSKYQEFLDSIYLTSQGIRATNGHTAIKVSGAIPDLDGDELRLPSGFMKLVSPLVSLLPTLKWKWDADYIMVRNSYFVLLGQRNTEKFTAKMSWKGDGPIKIKLPVDKLLDGVKMFRQITNKPLRIDDVVKLYPKGKHLVLEFYNHNKTNDPERLRYKVTIRDVSSKKKLKKAFGLKKNASNHPMSTKYFLNAVTVFKNHGYKKVNLSYDVSNIKLIPTQFSYDRIQYFVMHRAL